ncbi:hypothetical protein SNE40_006119 [Patella caerulea]|uniref:Uncharacterized protein n=1 Tax=Patella caerulea TaxID=87958 RepID=A0AAN8PVN9_PATCE
MVVMCSQRTEYGCYVPRDSPCSSHNITCDDQTRIFIEDLFYGSNPSITKCPAIRDKYDCRSNPCCSPGTGDTPIASTRQDSLLVHKACALQQSCAVTPQYRSNTGYHYCGYRYWCMEGKSAV